MGNVETTYMLATLCAVVVNVIQSALGGKGGKQHSITALDFMPDWGGEYKESSTKPQSTKAETVDEMKALFQQLASSSSKKRKVRRPPPPKGGKSEHR